MATNKEKTRDVLVRDIPAEAYNFIIDEQSKFIKEGTRKSLSTIIIEYLTIGIAQSKNT